MSSFLGCGQMSSLFHYCNMSPITITSSDNDNHTPLIPPPVDSASYARGAPLPHVLLHGAPGSGKSLIARKFAKACGLNTVIVSGGDVGPLGATASSELAGIFRWTAGVARRGTGVALIMDEAEAALGDRRQYTVGTFSNARVACTCR